MPMPALSALCLLLIAYLLLAPAAALALVRATLALWWGSIVPAQLPFFLCAGLLTAGGWVEAWARRWQSLMRPLLYLPGAAAPAVLLGFCAGFPSGALMTATLYRRGLLSRAEAARLLSCCNNPGPLYLSAGVATALLDAPQLAGRMLCCCYGGSLLLGMLAGIAARLRREPLSPAPPPQRAQIGRLDPLQLLKETTVTAAQQLLLIGALMVLCALLARLIADAGLLALLQRLGLGTAAAEALLSATCELSIGMAAIAELPLTAPRPLLCLLAAGWGGLSVQAQVMAMLADTDISPRAYLLSRPAAMALAALLWWATA